MSTAPPLYSQPERPRSGGGGCWQAVAITCGVGCLLVIVGSVALYFWAAPRVKTAIRPMVKTIEQTQQAAAQMQTVWKAAERFRADKGRYPDTLEALVPKYMPDTSLLTFPPGPGGKKLTYHKPAPDASPTTVVLEYNGLVLPIPGSPPTPLPIRVLKNGQIESQGQTNSGRGRWQYTPSGTAEGE